MYVYISLASIDAFSHVQGNKANMEMCFKAIFRQSQTIDVEPNLNFGKIQI